LPLLGRKSLKIATGAKHLPVTRQHHRADFSIFITAGSGIKKFPRHLRDKRITFIGTVETDQPNAVIYFKGD
jgi:hypothetical protein